MNRAFKEYNKTKNAEKIINDAKDAAKKEYDDRADSYNKAKALGDSNLSIMEREMNDFRQTREKQLQEQAVKMRDRIVAKITSAAKTCAERGRFGIGSYWLAVCFGFRASNFGFVAAKPQDGA